MTTYSDIEDILLDNCIPFKTVKNVDYSGEHIEAIEVWECGLILQQKEQLIRQLLDGENVKISSRDETIEIKI